MFATLRNVSCSLVLLLGISGAAQANVVLNTVGSLRFTDAKDMQGKHFHVHPIFLEAGRNYSFNMGSAHFDTFMILRNPFGQVVRVNDDGGPGLNSRFVFTPLVSGTFQLHATSFSPSATGAYHLRVDRSGGFLLNRQGDLSFNDPKVAGRHQKFFSVFLQANRQYVIEMNSPHFDTFLKLMKNGVVLRQNDDSGPGRNSRIVFTPSVSGPYTLIATSFLPGATGHFTVTIRD